MLTMVAFTRAEERMSSLNGVDTGAVFKHLVHCFVCEEAFYFTLRRIAEGKTLRCPQCDSDIDLADAAYNSLVTSTKETLAPIDSLSLNAGAAPKATQRVKTI
jgi:hypothetical protein